IWETDDIFSERLFVVNQPAAFPKSLIPKISGASSLKYKQQPITPLLPIKRPLLDYLTAEDIAERISFEETAEGIRARLKLPLEGLDGDEGSSHLPMEYEISKDFILNN